jgi:hypothetical protein
MYFISLPVLYFTVVPGQATPGTTNDNVLCTGTVPVYNTGDILELFLERSRDEGEDKNNDRIKKEEEETGSGSRATSGWLLLLLLGR